jgi:hypothetical protein
MLVLLAPDVLAHAAGSATIKRLDGFGMTANRFAYTLILGIPMAFYLAQKLRSAPLRWLYLLYIPGAILVVILSGSRGMFVALLVAGFALLWLLLKGEPIGKARVSRTRLFVSIGYSRRTSSGPIGQLRHVVESQLERILTITDAVESDVGGRWNIWVAGFGVFLDNLWVGVGSGHFSRAIIPFFEGDVFVFSFLGAGAAAHNTFLAIAVETGTIGLLIFGAMLFALMRNMRGIGRTGASPVLFPVCRVVSRRTQRLVGNCATLLSGPVSALGLCVDVSERYWRRGTSPPKHPNKARWAAHATPRSTLVASCTYHAVRDLLQPLSLCSQTFQPSLHWPQRLKLAPQRAVATSTSNTLAQIKINPRPIAFFIPGLEGGGAQRVFVTLVNTLVSLSDHPIHLVTSRGVRSVRKRSGQSRHPSGSGKGPCIPEHAGACSLH